MGASTFSVTSVDSVGGSAIISYTLTINPGLAITTAPGNWTVNQPGYSQTLITKGGTGSVTFAQTAGTLPPGVALTSSGALSGTPTTSGTFSFTITATDAVGATATGIFTVTINPQPTITTTTLPIANWQVNQPGYELIRVTGGTGPFTFTITGSDPPGVSITNGGGLYGTPTAVGTYSFTVTVTDAAGATTSQAYTLTVTPGPVAGYVVAPQGTMLHAGTGFVVTVQAADQYGNAVTSYSGPTMAMVTISPTSAGSSLPTSVTIGSNGFGFFLVTVQQAGTYSLSVTNSSYSGNSNPLTVTPGPAVKLGFAAAPTDTPTGDVLPAVSVQVEDLYGNVVASDSSDSVTIGIGSGPPGAPGFTSGSTLTSTVQNGVATFSNLTLVTPGTYQLSAVVPGLYTGPFSGTFTVLPLEVMAGSFVGTPSGFSLQFNAPILVNAVTPVLYGQSTLTQPAPAPSVIVTTDPGNLNDKAAYVTGSMVLNPVANSITFLATNTSLQADKGSPVLPDGVYTVIVRSGPINGASTNTGFQAANSGGGFLDGLGSGSAGSGDFTATFTVNAAAMHEDVLWAPDTADGPGQTLNAPGMNQIGGGYPIYLNDSTGNVTDAQVTLNYDPTLLHVSGVTGAGFSLLNSSTPGHAVLQYSGPALPAGPPHPIGFITATVPSGTAAKPTPYRATDLLHLSSVLLNGGTIPVATCDGLHLVAYVGDANGDGAYSGDDALRITRVILQTDSGFAAYPRVDPVIVADTDGSGFIPSDAALQVNEAGVGVPTANLPIPPIPVGVHFEAHADRVVSPVAPASTSAKGTPPALAVLDAIGRVHAWRWLGLPAATDGFDLLNGWELGSELANVRKKSGR